MYSSAVRPVTLPDGAKVKALVFVTNPDSAKSLASVFKDREGVSPQRLAYLMTSASKAIWEDRRSTTGSALSNPAKQPRLPCRRS